MKDLNDGYVPKELRAKYNKPVGIALEDKRDKAYRPPTPPPYVAYQGAGTGLSTAAGTGGAVNKESTDGKPAIDESKPKTNVQIRFHNGERVSLALNMHHTVGDIHTFVMMAAPVDGEY
jgi:hypothetical protein